MSDSEITLSGCGLHTGEPGQVSLCPQRKGGAGITFERTDLEGQPRFAATVESVRSTDRHTVLGARGSAATVATTEHLLAALAGLGRWDMLIKVLGPEIQILDGSARLFVDALTTLQRPTAIKPIRLMKAVAVTDEERSVRVTPSDHLSIRCEVFFNHPQVGRQRASWDGTTAQFIHELSPARTFGFLEEVDALRRRGLAAGGSPENALIFGQKGPLRPLRFENEPARHKLLDAIGDLALLGRPLAAQVELYRPGHDLMVELVRKIVSVMKEEG